MDTPYDIKVAPKARQHILQLSQSDQRTIIKLIEGLAFNPRPPGSHKIDGMTGLYVEHVDHLRVIYKIEEDEILILFAK